jgi:hypothetical protein
MPDQVTCPDEIRNCRSAWVAIGWPGHTIRRDPAPRAAGRAKARWIHRFESNISTQSGYCRCWFEKQPEGQSRSSANGSEVGRRVCDGRERKGETLVSERQDGPQLRLRPYT